MKKLFYLLLPLLVLSACNSQSKFTVEGNVDNAKGNTLYFEMNALNGVQLLDSVVLGSNGRFRFKASVPETPEFYRLRMGKRSIALGIDAPAKVTIHTDSAAFNTAYTVEGSYASERMQFLSQQLRPVNEMYRSISEQYKGVTDQEAINQAVDSLMKVVDAFKESVRPIVFEDPKSPAAYYALFMKVGQMSVFTPYNKEDNRLFSAVATAWQTFYPESLRGKSLVTYTLGGIQSLRKGNDVALPDDVTVREVDKMHSFDISLPNVFGENVSLSSLEGKVVMLDFTAFQSENSAERVLLLRELYNAYAAYGFEIYQVSYDTDEHFWKTAALNLPWTCVRDANILSSAYLNMYNVSSLPTYFLIDRGGYIVARDMQIDDIEVAVSDLLQGKNIKLK